METANAVPNPRIGLSVSGGIITAKLWDETYIDVAAGYPLSDESPPTFPEAYWPAREANWSTWA